MSDREIILRECEKDPKFAEVWLSVQRGVARDLTFESENTTTTEETASQTMDSGPSTSESKSSFVSPELSDVEVKNLMDKYYYGSSKLLHKVDYPFYAEGIVLPSFGKIEVFSRRVGKFEISGDIARNSKDDFVYWLEMGNGIRRGFTFFSPKKSLAIFRPVFKYMKKPEDVSITSFGMLGYSRSGDETTWIVWNDHCGLMKAKFGSARISKNKYGIMHPRMEIVKFTGSIGMGNQLEISEIVHHTDTSLQESGFPTEVVYVDDLEYDSKIGNRHKFWSQSLKIFCIVNDYQFAISGFDENQKYISFIVPNFEDSRVLEWRGLILTTSENAKSNDQLGKFEKLAMKNNVKLFPFDNNSNVAPPTTNTVSCDVTFIKSE
ncbi:unnamed protein product [Caenorhabditis angaria]|uniref:Uncharacterized protein n=1 Tax=Caenorhabditis angaria TaxID=860376 RepID=A0A9P1IRF4_9PELO|nr:unnamed protein product [Caenorhabditis angaria]